MITLQTDLAHLALALTGAGFAGFCFGVSAAAAFLTRAPKLPAPPAQHGADQR